jgi:hypothetical protein
MPQRSTNLNKPSVSQTPHIGVLDEREDGLLTYFTALNAHLQNYLRDGKSLHSYGARLSSGDGMFLLWYGSESEQQTGMARGLWSLDSATTMLSSRLEGDNLAERAQRFLMDVRATDGDSSAVLIAKNGLIFYRPQIDPQHSAHEAAAADALSIARSVT